MIAIALGLAAALLYGAADFCGGIATKRAAVFSVMLVSQTASIIPLAFVALALPAHVVWADYVAGTIAGLCGGIGLAALYYALSIGTMGIVSPVTAVVGAVIPVVAAVVLRGEHLAFAQNLGIIVALVAVVLIAYSRTERRSANFERRAFLIAIASGVFLGASLFFLASSHPQAGLRPLIAARAASILLFLAMSLVARVDLRPRGGNLGIIVLTGLLDVAANGFYVFAAYRGYHAVAAVVTSLYPASTVLLARVVLSERLQRSQQVGVACALASVALIAW